MTNLMADTLSAKRYREMLRCFVAFIGELLVMSAAIAIGPVP